MPRPFPSNVATDGTLLSDAGPGVTKPGPGGPNGPSFSADGDLDGTRTAQRVIGFRERPVDDTPPGVGETYVFDGLKWVSGIVVGGTLEPLSRTLFVDGGTVSATRDGSVANPYLTLQEAMNFVGSTGSLLKDWLVLVGPGEYSEVSGHIDVPHGKSITFDGGSRGSTKVYTSSPPQNGAFRVSQIVGDTETVVIFRNLDTSVTFSRATGSQPLRIAVEDCIMGVLRPVTPYTGLEVDVDVRRSFVGAADDPAVSSAGTLTAEYTTFSNFSVSCFIAALKSCILLDGASLLIAATTSRMDDCILNSGSSITFTGAPGILEVDGITAASILTAAAPLTGGVVRIDDTPDYMVRHVTSDNTPTPVVLYLPDALSRGYALNVEVWVNAYCAFTEEASSAAMCGVFLWESTDNFTQVGATATLHSTGPFTASLSVDSSHIFVNLVGHGTQSVSWTVTYRILTSYPADV